MRTRVSGSLPAQMAFPVEHTNIPNEIIGYGTNGLPVWGGQGQSGPASVTGQVVFGNVPSSYSIMIDEIGRKPKTGYVDHYQIKADAIPMVTFVSGVNRRRNGGNPPIFDVYDDYVAQIEQSPRPWGVAWSDRFTRPTPPGQLSLLPPIGRPALSLISDESELVSKLQAKVMGAISKLQLAVTAMESREIPKTLSLIRDMIMFKNALFKGKVNPAIGHAVLTKLVKKRRAIGRFRSVSRIGLSPSDKAAIRKEFGKMKANTVINRVNQLIAGAGSQSLNWLFGIVPTYGDIVNIMYELEAADRPSNRLVKGVVVTASLRKRVDPAQREVTLGSQWCEGYTVTRGRWERVVRRAFIQAKKDPGGESRNFSSWLRQYVGANPIGVAWQVVPASFMVDWVVNVEELLDSAYLQNQSFLEIEWSRSELVQVSETMTSRYRSGVVQRVGPPSPPPSEPFVWVFGRNEWNLSFKSYKRGVLPTSEAVVSKISVLGPIKGLLQKTAIASTILLLPFFTKEQRKKMRRDPSLPQPPIKGNKRKKK